MSDSNYIAQVRTLVCGLLMFIFITSFQSAKQNCLTLTCRQGMRVKRAVLGSQVEVASALLLFRFLAQRLHRIHDPVVAGSDHLIFLLGRFARLRL